jgi:hypothetical protein
VDESVSKISNLEKAKEVRLFEFELLVLDISLSENFGKVIDIPFSYFKFFVGDSI